MLLREGTLENHARMRWPWRVASARPHKKVMLGESEYPLSSEYIIVDETDEVLARQVGSPYTERRRQHHGNRLELPDGCALARGQKGRGIIMECEAKPGTDMATRANEQPPDAASPVLLEARVSIQAPTVEGCCRETAGLVKSKTMSQDLQRPP